MAADKWPPTFVEGFHNVDSVRQMEYRKLDGTDMFVSKLGLGKQLDLESWFDLILFAFLGGGPFGGSYRSCDQEAVNSIVLESLRNGVNFIDTAYWYGQGRSEEALGEVSFG